jgi:hypothetical protein
MTRFAPLFVVALAACEPMPPSGNPLKPVPAARTTAPAPTAKPSADVAPDPDSPFVEDQVFDAPPDPDAEPSGDDVLLRAQLGAAEGELPEPAPVTPAPPVVESPPLPPAPRPWDGSMPPEGGGSWGVSLLATLLDVQPPRAVIALPDGSERVVQPGALLPEHRLVVLAIGRDAVQIAHIEPMGWNSRVQTSTLRSLFQP